MQPRQYRTLRIPAGDRELRADAHLDGVPAGNRQQDRILLRWPPPAPPRPIHWRASSTRSTPTSGGPSPHHSSSRSCTAPPKTPTLLADLATACPDLATDDLTDRPARILFVADLWGRTSESPG